MAAVEGEKKADKEKCIPKDGQVMISILKDMGINDFEPRVVNQMLEFSYRCVLKLCLVLNINYLLIGGMLPMYLKKPKYIPSMLGKSRLIWTT